MTDDIRTVGVTTGLEAPAEFCLAVLGEWRETLLRELAAGHGVAISLRNVGEIDAGGLQLLCAAHQAFGAGSQDLRLTEVPPAVSQARRAAGFEAAYCNCPMRDQPCPWPEEKEE